MANIIDHLTWEVYLYIQRGLFERHKLPFALILATKILTSAGKVRLCSKQLCLLSRLLQ